MKLPPQCLVVMLISMVNVRTVVWKSKKVGWLLLLMRLFPWHQYVYLNNMMYAIYTCVSKHKRGTCIYCKRHVVPILLLHVHKSHLTINAEVVRRG